MAKHDRITLRVREGEDIPIVARRAGGRVDVKVTARWVTVRELNAARVPEMIREAQVSAGDVVAIIRDRTTDEKRPPRQRSRSGSKLLGDSGQEQMSL